MSNQDRQGEMKTRARAAGHIYCWVVGGVYNDVNWNLGRNYICVV